MRRRAFLAMVGAGAACGRLPLATPAPTAVPTATSARRNPRDTIVVALREEPRSLDGAPGEAVGADRLAANLVHSQLVGFDDAGSLRADLADSIPTLENGGARFIGDADSRQLQVTFKLRRGAPPAADAVAAWRRTLAAGPVISTEARLERLEAPDASTLVCTFFSERSARAAASREPDRYGFLEGQRGPILDPLYSLGLPNTWVGLGPYALAEWRRGELLRFTARADYHLGAPKTPNLVLRVSPDPEAALRAGEADLILSSAPASAPGIQELRAPSTAWEHVDCNLDHPALADPGVRAALLHALDRRALAADAGGLAEDQPAFGRYPFDTARATELLDRAGWVPGPDGVRAKAGARLSLRLLRSNAPERARLAGRIRDQLAAVGVEIKDEPVAPEAMLGWPDGHLAGRDFDLALFATAGGPSPLDDLAELHGSASVPSARNGRTGQNYPGFRDAPLDAMFAAASGTLDFTQRAQVLGQVHDRVLAFLPSLPLFTYPRIVAAPSELKGVRPPSLPIGETWNVGDWQIG